MRGTKRFERRVTTPYFKVGTLTRKVGEGSITVDDSAGLPFDTLKIQGNTVTEVPNRAEVYLSYLTSEGYYSSAGTNGAYCISLPSEFIGKELTYELTTKIQSGGAELYLADGGSALFANLTPLCDSSGRTYRVTGNTFTHLIFLNVNTSDKEMDDGSVLLVKDGIVSFWQGHGIKITSEPAPDFYSPVSSLGDSAARFVLTYDGKNKVITFPSKITQNGQEIVLRLSLFDEILVDRKNQRVIYKDGTVLFTLTGNEGWKIYEEGAARGNGVFAYAQMPTAFSEGFCPYLKFAPWIPPTLQKNVFSVFNNRNLAIKLERNEKDPTYFKTALNEIVNMIKERQKSGVPVTVIARRKQALQYDISSSTLARALLAAKVPREKETTVTVRGANVYGFINASYYATEEAENVKLTVLCIDEDITELNMTEHLLRKGSAYCLTLPSIEGYTTTENEIFGAITEDKTVVIEYKEKK